MRKSITAGNAYDELKNEYRTKQSFSFGRLYDNVWCI